jgi:alcohol dehydrogenase, propanol-preferring
MRALLLDVPGTKLREAEIRRPELRPGEVRIRVHACGVCRTDLHIRDGELTGSKLPLVLGHQVVGTVVEGDDPAGGGRVGVPWLGWTCGECRYCRSGRENLCDRARFTGYTLDGGYAEEVVADARYCLSLPEGPSDAELAPLLCAGLIGSRSLRAAGDGERLGLYGFGASAHIVAQLARNWGERVVRSVANLTREDGRELFRAVRAHPVQTAVEVFSLAAAEVALDRLRRGAVRGAAVLAVADQPPAAE